MPLITPAAIWLNEVAKSGSIRAAAARLNVSPSAVNRQILNLEAEYSAELFERLPRGVRLTAAGEVLVAEIREWLHDHDKLRRHLNELRGMVRGHASIGVMESMSARMVSRLMAFMRDRRSHVSIEVKVGGTEDLIDRLLKGQLDLVVGYAVPRHSGIEVLSTHGPTSGIVAAVDHPLASRKTIRLTDCKDYTFVLPDDSLTVRRTMDAAFEAAAFTPTSIVTTNSVEVMKMLVMEHGQLAMLAMTDVHSEVRAGQMVHIPFQDRFVIGSQLSLVAQRNSRLSPVATMLSAHLRDFLDTMQNG